MCNIVYIEKLGDAMAPMGLYQDPPLKLVIDSRVYASLYESTRVY